MCSFKDFQRATGRIRNHGRHQGLVNHKDLNRKQTAIKVRRHLGKSSSLVFFFLHIFSLISFHLSVSIWKFTFVFVWNMVLPVHSLCRFCFSERIPQFTAMCAQPGYGWAKWSGHRVVPRVCIGLLLSFFIINCREVGQTSKADNYPEFCLLFCLFAFQKKRWV